MERATTIKLLSAAGNPHNNKFSLANPVITRNDKYLAHEIAREEKLKRNWKKIFLVSWAKICFYFLTKILFQSRQNTK